MDYFEGEWPSLEAPASRVVAVTPNDNAELAFATRAIAVNVTGIVRFETIKGDIADLHIAAGAPLPVRARKIFATGTTADGINALA